MTAGSCREVFEAAPVNERAAKLDYAHPRCTCEPWALTQVGGEGIPNGEKVARILTTPGDYNEATATIVTSRLTAIYSMGMSVVQEGAADGEIIDTINVLLTGGAEARKLFGAVIISAERIREFANDDDKSRWFGLYATDDSGKTHHGDVLGVTVNKKQQSKRRGELANEMLPLIIKADHPNDLLRELRLAGI